MVAQLNAFASEVTRVAREARTEGKLGGQADAAGAGGPWQDLADTSNAMARELTKQCRAIAAATTAAANGMIGSPATVGGQGCTGAPGVGNGGKPGGQANVPGGGGTWPDPTDKGNPLAATLTTQIRAIAEVATAVTTGDLSRSITVE